MSSSNGDQFRRFAQQIQRRATSGGMPGGRGALAGGGALFALVGGGILLSTSLFNGKGSLANEQTSC
jgi:prohibitin 2